MSPLRVRSLAAVALVAASLLVAAPADAASTPSAEVLFDGGNEAYVNGTYRVDYHSFRAPAVIRTKGNTVIAFAEGRVGDNDDYGNIDLIYKTSRDSGKPGTWSGIKAVATGWPDAVGNPTAVFDGQTVYLFFNRMAASWKSVGDFDSWDDREVWVASSATDANGLPMGGWTLTEKTDTLKPHKDPSDPLNRRWFNDSIGPGAGIKMTDGTLVIPAKWRNIYKRPGDTDWHYQELTNTDVTKTDEATILQRFRGDLYRNDRARFANAGDPPLLKRLVATGTLDGGFSGYADHLEPGGRVLPDPDCQASTLRFAGSPNRILFLGPHPGGDSRSRTPMRVWMSYDDGVGWPYTRLLGDFPAPRPKGRDGRPNVNGVEGGYSSMLQTADNQVGAAIEWGEQNSSGSDKNMSIIFRRFHPTWIANGRPEPPPG
ncbi:sialidase family protein [Nonomuraea sp. NPDC050786]|uniref:sialidase family protein n=1 Tax=Nonomuraea sp. NPDC050786 TaxID=3154840 RepID=UPI0033F6A5FF